MKRVTLLATCHADLCNGCSICWRVCPTLAISMVDKKAVMDKERCNACGTCAQACDTAAITMEKLDEPHVIGTSSADLPLEQIESLCIKAGFNPSQVICLCTHTRADEVAAAIIKGAHSLEEINLQTGLRGGCVTGCHQPPLRLLEAHGVTPTPTKGGWQWYGHTPTLQEIPEAVKAKYRGRGFQFEEDIRLLASLVQSERR